MGEQVSGGQMFSGRLAGACSDGRQTGWHRGICVWRHHAIHTHTHTHTHQPLRSRAVLDDLTNYPLVPGLPAGSAARRPIASEF